jgi:hypothetical protein
MVMESQAPDVVDVAEDEVPETPEAAFAPGDSNALVSHRTPARGQSMLDDVANDLALWIDQTATEVALAFSPARAPFSAQITEAQKLEFYKNQLFLPDGSPNQQGRQQEIARLGAEGFGQVYKAVVSAYPQLKPAPPPEIAVPEEWPVAPEPPLGGPPMMPPAPPPVPMLGGP